MAEAVAEGAVAKGNITDAAWTNLAGGDAIIMGSARCGELPPVRRQVLCRKRREMHHRAKQAPNQASVAEMLAGDLETAKQFGGRVASVAARFNK